MLLICCLITPVVCLLSLPLQILMTEKDKAKLATNNEKRKAAEQEMEPLKDLKKVRPNRPLP